MFALYSRTEIRNRTTACLSVSVGSHSPFSGSTSDYCQGLFSRDDPTSNVSYRKFMNSKTF